jgi:hypothetical protein
MTLWRHAWTCVCLTIAFAAVTGARGWRDHTFSSDGAGPQAASSSQAPRPATRRVIALAEPGQTIHQPFADAAMKWLQETAVKEGFAVDYIRTTDPIDEAYLAAHDGFIQVNYPPYTFQVQRSGPSRVGSADRSVRRISSHVGRDSVSAVQGGHGNPRPGWGGRTIE